MKILSIGRKGLRSTLTSQISNTFFFKLQNVRFSIPTWTLTKYFKKFFFFFLLKNRIYFLMTGCARICISHLSTSRRSSLFFFHFLFLMDREDFSRRSEDSTACVLLLLLGFKPILRSGRCSHDSWNYPLLVVLTWFSYSSPNSFIRAVEFVRSFVSLFCTRR